ncbi:MAG: tRNA (guanine37-N1)-methyltransferase [Parcubacteria group bacterium Gr01-1014_72]|nr:MAG: tRNA (guanine37-N1)-methyltransferase [Parcubacteria group bacterium Gr01-1014_72]
MRFHIVTLFPKAFDSYLGESIVKRAIEDGKIAVKFYNPRDFADNKWRRIDRAPYGGGPGMVIQAEPVIRAIEKAFFVIHSKVLKNFGMKKTSVKAKKLLATSHKLSPIIWLTPSGKQFTNEYARKVAKRHSNIIIVCGRYEGIDARVKKVFQNTTRITNGKRMTRIGVEEISVGPFVLTGGELPAMVMIDAIARQVQGVLGNEGSREEERVASPDVYTRPEVFEYKKKRYRVPKVLLTGHHRKIEEWRASVIKRRRPHI